MEAARTPWPALGGILLRDGKLTVAQLEQALADKRGSGRRLGEILVERGWIRQRDVAEALAEQLELPFADLATTGVDQAAALLLPERHARRLGVLVTGFVGDDAVTVATSDPTNVVAADELRMTLGLRLHFLVAAPEALERATNRVYRVEEIAEAEEEGDEEPLAETIDITQAVTTAPAVKLVHALLARAVAEGASDLHFEPQARHVVVRGRIDGVLRRLALVPRGMQGAVIGRLKIMGRLDIAERRAPQDGRMTVHVDGRAVDMRIAVVPTAHGEHVVLRILSGQAQLPLRRLGMAERELAAFSRAIRQPHGAVVVCGPTGSGKTTTLYAALDALNDEGRAIQTIEDPVEALLEGVSQVEVCPRAGLTFASGLRTILRSDPDVLLIGEIRDEETARIAMQAALTGHLVLTSLHAPSAPAAFARLRDIGVEDGLLASAVTCVVAQRLVRRLCPDCRQAYYPSVDEFAALGVEARLGLRFHRARGCGSCAGTGYVGRQGLYEVVEVDDAIRACIGLGPSELARVAGMRSLHAAGVALVVDGVTSVDELARVAGDRLA